VASGTKPSIVSSSPACKTEGRCVLERNAHDGIAATLFLAQLSNLLAGKYLDRPRRHRSSRTFMGEESAGVDAVRIALSRIQSGQSDIVLVGGAHNGERRDLLLLLRFGGQPKGAVSLGLGACGTPAAWRWVAGGLFSSLKRATMRKPQAKPHARLSSVISDRSNRTEGQRSRRSPAVGQVRQPDYARQGCSDLRRHRTESATAAERAWLEPGSGCPVRATGTYPCHGFEANNLR